MAIVEFEKALDHLRIARDDQFQEALYDDIRLKLEAVSEIVLDFCDLPRDHFLNEDGSVDYDSVPYSLKAGVLVYLGILFVHRDGTSDENLQLHEIPRSVSNILSLYRKPGLA